MLRAALADIGSTVLAENAVSSGTMYAEIAIPLHVHQTFTYRLPESFADKAKPGCRALVPFGKQLLTGYIVDLHETAAEAGLDAEAAEIKEVEELFDTDPLVTPELLDLTKWIADYYFAPWGEVIKSCLPAGINAEAETILAVTEAGREALAAGKQTIKMQALALIAASETLTASALAKELTKPRANAVIRELEKLGYVTLTRQLQTAQVKPKRIQAVRLAESAPVAERKALNHAIEDWRKDWETRDVNRYLAHYSKNFRNNEGGYDRWAEQKRLVTAGKTWIKVELGKLSVFRSPGKEDLVVVTFEQDYRSNNLSNVLKKRQYWLKEGGRWKIVYEGFA